MLVLYSSVRSAVVCAYSERPLGVPETSSSPTCTSVVTTALPPLGVGTMCTADANCTCLSAIIKPPTVIMGCDIGKRAGSCCSPKAAWRVT